jgi:hypothetical protein
MVLIGISNPPNSVLQTALRVSKLWTGGCRRRLSCKEEEDKSENREVITHVLCIAGRYLDDSGEIWDFVVTYVISRRDTVTSDDSQYFLTRFVLEKLIAINVAKRSMMACHVTPGCPDNTRSSGVSTQERFLREKGRRIRY